VPYPPEPVPWAWPLPPRRSRWREYGVPALLFVLTVLSVDLVDGPQLVLGLLSILAAHEMGHYLACRYYRVDATLPHFIPFPFSFVGTLGAFIRIRGPIPHRKALFDIGIAGPLAGFVVCLPVLVLGTLQAKVIPTPPAGSDEFISFGDPLLVRWAYAWLRGDPGAGHTFLMGPLATAGWFGLLVTALNLIPVGQLDGGHVTYALLGKRALLVSQIAFGTCVALIYFGPNWLVWSVLLLVLGRRHPRTSNDHLPVGRGRVAVGLLGLVVLALCFVPDPIVGSWPKLQEGLRALLTSR
jgi:membrane-associated protease RseP (regulator of RpoE activity)